MKTIVIKIIGIVLVMLPAMATAQTNIESAFDKFLGNSDVSYTERHHLTKDSESGLKISQYDVYTYSMPAGSKGLINDLQRAFKQDIPKAYSVESGVMSSQNMVPALALGDNAGSVSVCENKEGFNFQYALFMAPKDEDPYNKFRYAYCISWINEKDIIRGQIMIVYGTTLQYRQKMDEQRMKEFLEESKLKANEDSWFKTFMTYVQGMTTEDVSTCRALATCLYEHCSEFDKDFDPKQDKETAREVLKTMISDDSYSDSIVRQLLTSALNNLAK